MFRRKFSTLKISKTVQNALKNNIPVVSLESTIITHGLPYPQNLEMALQVEKEIKKFGVIPATTAFINGIPTVGLSKTEIETLAKSKSASKVSRRDIPYVMTNKLNGGTTISGTMILSQKAGIKIFATGGLGGVHRDGENTMDVSADLDELGKTSVAVVCAGPKSILDIERTMEYLETKGVPVITMGKGNNIPGFYTRDSGVKSVYNFENFKEAANIIKNGELMNLNNGYLFCIPPPKEVALDSNFINGIIDKANEKAKLNGLKGKELTPFLLKTIAEETKGKSVESNIQFVLNNARSAAQIALEYYKLNKPDNEIITDKIEEIEEEEEEIGNLSETHDSIVVGSVALDTYCSLNGKVIMNDSNPSKISSSIGGVGYNVAFESFKSGNSSLKFISNVGSDLYGENIIKNIKFDKSIDKVFDRKFSTSQYISFHDLKGDLIISSSDMDIIEQLDFKFVEKEIIKSKPQYVLMDSNISIELMQHLLHSSELNKFKLIFEPTSYSKSKKLSKLRFERPIFLATPTLTELESMYEAFEDSNQFDLDYWFPIIDTLGIDGNFRTKFETLCSKQEKYHKLISRGVLQLGVSLLPFINTLIIKDGAQGVYLLSCHENIDTIKVEKRASFSLKSRGKEGHGILFEHYDVPKRLESVGNVTGAGDALVGHLLGNLARSDSSGSLLDGEFRFETIHAAQEASALKITQ